MGVNYQKTFDFFIKKLKEQGKFDLVGEFKLQREDTLFRCRECGYEFISTREKILRRRFCPKCSVVKRRFHRGSKSIQETNPDLAQNIANKKDRINYTEFSNQVILWRCVGCGSEFLKSPSSMRKGFFCSNCSDGISFPNKIFYNVLIQLNVDFDAERSFDWSKFGNRKRFVYDFYLKDKNIIVEMMGKQHYDKKSLYYASSSYDIEERDREKFNIAIKNGIFKYYQIDCSSESFNSIKTSIIEVLGEEFNFDFLDWDMVLRCSLKSLIIQVCNFYDSNFDLSVGEIAARFKLTATTILKYLKFGAKSKICSYTKEDSKRRRANYVTRKSFKRNESIIKKVCDYYNKTTITVKELALIFNINPQLARSFLIIGNDRKMCNYIIKKR